MSSHALVAVCSFSILLMACVSDTASSSESLLREDPTSTDATRALPGSTDTAAAPGLSQCVGFDEGRSCEWRVEYASGLSETVASCLGFEANQCCDEPVEADLETGEISGLECPVSCYRACTESYEFQERDEHLGASLRGFPTFHQFKTDSESSSCPDEVKVGCGPIAAVQTLAWFDMLGFNRIGNGYRNGDALKWRTMASTLRNDYVGTSCNDDSTSSSTMGPELKRGISNFLDDEEVPHSISLHRFGSGSAADHFTYIQQYVDANHPVILGYCSRNNDGEGIGETIPKNDDCGSHWGVIVGYDWRDGDRYVHIVTGWGNDTHNQTKSFDFSKGRITLIYVAPDWSIATGDTWCAADDEATYYNSTSRVSYWAESGARASYPVIDSIVGNVCDRIGGWTYRTGRHSWVDTCIAGSCDVIATGEPTLEPIDEEIPDRLYY